MCTAHPLPSVPQDMRKHVTMTLLDTEQSYVESLRTLMQVRLPLHGQGAGVRGREEWPWDTPPSVENSPGGYPRGGSLLQGRRECKGPS